MDGDGLIENSGEPDQTYDSWVVQGASSYCGGLWLAALVAAVRIGEILKEPAPVIEEYQKLLDKGRSAYHDKLWNGIIIIGFFFLMSKSKKVSSL